MFLLDLGIANRYGGMEEKRFSGYRHMRDVARRLRREATGAEQVLWDLLRGRRCYGYRFLRQRAIGVYVVDFYCPALHLAVEVDGAIHDREDVWQNDAHREAWLQERGVMVMRLSNEDVFQSEPDIIYRRILLAVGKRIPPLDIPPPAPPFT